MKEINRKWIIGPISHESVWDDVISCLRQRHEQVFQGGFMPNRYLSFDTSLHCWVPTFVGKDYPGTVPLIRFYDILNAEDEISSCPDCDASMFGSCDRHRWKG